jgi:hypothetical protein
MLKVELKRAFINLSFLFAFLISLLSLLSGLYGYGYDYADSGVGTHPQVDPMLYNTFDATLNARFGVISLIAPLMAALPFAASFAVDSTSGYIRPLVLRSGKRSYVIAKVIANFLAGAVALALPHVIIYAIAALTFPEGLTNPVIYRQSRMIVKGTWETIYWGNPVLYIWLIILLTFLFGGIYATLGMAAGTVSNNRYVALATPFIFYLVGSFIIASLGYTDWLPTVSFTPQLVTNSTEISIFGNLLMVFIGSTAVIAASALIKLKDA